MTRRPTAAQVERALVEYHHAFKDCADTFNDDTKSVDDYKAARARQVRAVNAVTRIAAALSRPARGRK